jgi:hypothetical protein
LANNLAAEKRAKELTDAGKVTADRIIAESGERELRITTLCAADNKRAVAKAGTAPRKTADREAAELRRAYAEPFIRLAEEADEVVIERNLCVAIAQKDRER